jgi:flavin reductase (DIM6/NTAB) family NADH-FMN oxidoreductase RutF
VIFNKKINGHHMEKTLNRVNVKNLTDNIFKLLDNDWMLITAGDLKDYNTMTASWGTFGILWNKPIAFCFIRPQRYTIEFVTKAEMFTLSFFEEKYRDALNFCGSHSGRQTDKTLQTGLTSVVNENGSIYFSEARLVLECRKLYSDSLKSENFFKDTLIKDIYPKGDFHHFFIGEIINCYSSEMIVKEDYIQYKNPDIDYFP